MKVCFDGIGGDLVTFCSDGAVKGQVVKVTAAGTVGACAAGNTVDGVAVIVDGGYAGVRLRGFASVACSDETLPAVGHAVLAADGDGGVKVVTSGGRDYLVADRDTAAGTLTILL